MSKKREENRNRLKQKSEKVSQAGQVLATRSTELNGRKMGEIKGNSESRWEQQKQRRFKEGKKQGVQRQNNKKEGEGLVKNSSKPLSVEKSNEVKKKAQGKSNKNAVDPDGVFKHQTKQGTEECKISVDQLKQSKKKVHQIKISHSSQRKMLTQQNEKQKKEERVDYLSILVKYKKLAGSTKATPKIKSAAKKQKDIAFKTQREAKLKNQQRVKSNRNQKPTIEGLVKEKKDDQEIKSIQEKQKLISSKTFIRFLLQKDRESKQIKKEEVTNKKMNGTAHGLNPSLMKNYIQSLMQTRRSQSLPAIKKQSFQKSPIYKKYRDGVENPEVREKKEKSLNDRKRQLNSIGFMLINLKQKIGESDLPKSRLQIRATSKKILESNESNELKNLHRDRFSENLFLNKEGNEERPPVAEVSGEKGSTVNSLEQKQKACVLEKKASRKQDILGTGSSRQDQILKKLAKKASMLQQIMEDIENENHEREQQLKQHNSANKLLQISILEKKKRVSDLQTQLQQLEMAQSNSKQGDDVKDLKQRKVAREKLYREERERIQQEMKSVEGRIYEQQKRYTKLKEDQIQIKDHQLREKQQALQTKNKQLEVELEKKTKELQETIKQQQSKSQFYKKELSFQIAKNKEISEEIKKQEDLEKLLLDQLEKFLKDKQQQNQQKNEKKNKQRQRLIDEIKILEETQNRILLEYQRDIQAAHSMFQSMRQKNIELENKIRMKHKQKQGGSS